MSGGDGRERVEAAWARRAVASLVGGVCLACGPSTAPDVDAGGGSTSTSVSSSTSTTASTTGLADTTASSTSPTTSDDDSTTGDPTCELLPARTDARVAVEHPPGGGGDVIDLDETCTITGVDGDATPITLALDCPSGPFELHVDADPPVSLAGRLAVDDQLHVRALHDYFSSLDEYNDTAVFDATGQMVAATYGWGVPPVDSAPLYLPMTFEATADVCPIIPLELDTDALPDPCSGDTEVLGIDFEYDGHQARVLDGDVGMLGPLEIRVAYAHRVYPLDGFCTAGYDPIDYIHWTALRVR